MSGAAALLASDGVEPLLRAARLSCCMAGRDHGGIGFALSSRMNPVRSAAAPGMLAGLRVIEVAAGLAEYRGFSLADLRADVITIEPPGGSPTHWIEPFFG